MQTPFTLFLGLVETFGTIALADFCAGIVHWLEDAYFSAETPVLGPLVIRPNIVHHHLPRYFTQLSWWESSKELVLIAALVVAFAWPLHLLSWQLWLFLGMSINANQVHKWSHQTRAENGPVISWLQDWHVLQTPRHHGLHHKDPKNTYYCPITNFVNPALEKIAFWTRLERSIAVLTGVTHRDDTAIRGHGPAPAWLASYRRDSQTAPMVLRNPLAPLPRTRACRNCPKPCAARLKAKPPVISGSVH